MGNYTSKYLFRAEPKGNCSPHGQEQWQKSAWRVQPLDTSTERAGETQKGKNHLRDSILNDSYMYISVKTPLNEL